MGDVPPQAEARGGGQRSEPGGRWPEAWWPEAGDGSPEAGGRRTGPEAGGRWPVVGRGYGDEGVARAEGSGGGGQEASSGAVAGTGTGTGRRTGALRSP